MRAPELTPAARALARELAGSTAAMSYVAGHALRGAPEAVAILNEYAADLAAEEAEVDAAR